MRHADYDFLHTLNTCGLNQLVHAGNKTFATFKRKAFLPDIFGVQKALKAFCCSNTLQNVALFISTKAGFAAARFELLLPPTFFVLVGDIHVLGTNRAAVSFAQCIEQLAQTHGVFAKKRVAGVENDFLIGIIETVKSGIKLRNMAALCTLERIEVGPTGTHIAVGGNQLLDRSALAPHFAVGTGHHHFGATLFGALGKSINNRLVRYILAGAAVCSGHVLQGVKILAPGVGHTGGVSEVVFVHLFDIRRVATEQIRIILIGLVH